MFIPSMLKSTPQVLDSGAISTSTLTGTVAVTAVNTNYSAIMYNGGAGGNISGAFDGSGLFAWKINSSTQVQWDRGYANVGNGTGAQTFAVLLEFVSGFLRQPVNSFLASATFAHGLTLGPKAFIITGGFFSTQDQTSVDSAVISAACEISGANVVFSSNGFASVRGYIIDPR